MIKYIWHWMTAAKYHISSSRSSGDVDYSSLYCMLACCRAASTVRTSLNLPSCILKWIGSFLTGRFQQVKYLNLISTPKPINRSIVQGSGIGPTLYIVMESDLRALSRFNIIFKYADDTNLLVPEHTDIDLAAEFQNILNWAKDNHMMVNISKTKELVFHRPSAKPPLPCPLTDIEQLLQLNYLVLLFRSH